MQVRSAFALTVHRAIRNIFSEIAARTGSQPIPCSDAVAIGKYVSMLSLAAWEADCDSTDALQHAELWLHGWSKKTKKVIREGRQEQRIPGSVLPLLPEYSIFFLIYMLSHHHDFPGPQQLAHCCDQIPAGVCASRCVVTKTCYRVCVYMTVPQVAGYYRASISPHELSQTIFHILDIEIRKGTISYCEPLELCCTPRFV